MMKAMNNAIRLQIARALASMVTSRVGSVSNYDPNTMTARVTLQPDGVMSGWLPVASQWIGNNWGLFAPPNIGDLVTVEYINGDLNSGTVVGRYYNQQSLPLAVPSGEFWLVHASGQFVKLTNDGKLSLADGHGATITLNGDGTIASAGTWSHTGSFTASGDVIGNGISLDNHTHLVENVQAGTSNITSQKGTG